MWKHKNFINLQLYAPPVSVTYTITVNGAEVKLYIAVYNWAQNLTETQEFFTQPYSIVDGKVIWENGQMLQYNGVDVLGTDSIVNNAAYTTQGGR